MVRNMFYTHYRRNIQHLAVKSSRFIVCCTRSLRSDIGAKHVFSKSICWRKCGVVVMASVWSETTYETPLGTTYLIMFIIITQKQLNYLRFG